ncbi:Malignant T-cell-amplified sequence 1 [Perkinsus olseni]|uniref:Malignant T-cell-amplified sequence 1 n=1 Tax=Perkinsus olseni TaxID=32597 RepID=A0A7J6P0Z7_PEROL|nr:Malignant T-cell-amplified sequence 1 [Perkinsus olseni]
MVNWAAFYIRRQYFWNFCWRVTVTGLFGVIFYMVGSVASSWNESVHRAWLHYVKKERERAELMELIRDARDAGILPTEGELIFSEAAAWFVDGGDYEVFFISSYGSDKVCYARGRISVLIGALWAGTLRRGRMRAISPTQNQAKSSVARGVKSSVVEDYPRMEECAPGLFPKKAQNVLVKCKDHVQMFAVNGEVLFFQLRDGPWIPTLRTLHRFPTMMPLVRVDRGAIRFVLKGANIMTPWFDESRRRSPAASGEGPDSYNAVVLTLYEADGRAIIAEGKEHICAIGRTLQSADEMRSTNQGIAIENIHYLNDGLWKLTSRPL